MQYKSLFLVVLLGCVGCAVTPFETSEEAEKNIVQMNQIRKKMTMSEVRKIMGRPYKKETTTMEGKTYITWFYVTKRRQVYQTEFYNENLTPLVFYNGYLIGWDYPFYNDLFDINQARLKKEEELRQQYTDDREEWPPDEHKIITPSQEDQVEEAIEKFLKDAIEEEKQSRQKQAIEEITPETTETPPTLPETKEVPTEQQQLGGEETFPATSTAPVKEEPTTEQPSE